MALTNIMDTHDVSRDRGAYPDVLARVTQPTLVFGISSDVLYPVHEQSELADNLGKCKGFVTIDSDEGHDGFLLEQEQIAPHIARFLAENAEAEFVV